MTEAAKTFVTQESCSRSTEALLQSQQALMGKMESIEKRLFKDNGSVSMQTRIDRHDQTLRLLLWVVGIIGGTLLVGFTGGLAMLVREILLKGAVA